uniref:Uncharacterized protein n=1 Tax=Anguilla anguilla TaxID=7936 RepID=A0A0E9TQ79_ANGAN
MPPLELSDVSFTISHCRLGSRVPETTSPTPGVKDDEVSSSDEIVKVWPTAACVCARACTCVGVSGCVRVYACGCVRVFWMG